jgi:uncharacterized membrane protein YhaH (DUF805 family)
MNADALSSRVLRLFCSPHGRISRSTYWLASIVLAAGFGTGFVLLESMAGRTATLILYPFLTWAALMLSVKRCHDRALSSAWLLLALIPVLGPLWWLIALGLRRGTMGGNQYGDDPLNNPVDYLTVK